MLDRGQAINYLGFWPQPTLVGTTPYSQLSLGAAFPIKLFEQHPSIRLSMDAALVSTVRSDAIDNSFRKYLGLECFRVGMCLFVFPR